MLNFFLYVCSTFISPYFALFILTYVIAEFRIRYTKCFCSLLAYVIFFSVVIFFRELLNIDKVFVLFWFVCFLKWLVNSVLVDFWCKENSKGVHVMGTQSTAEKRWVDLEAQYK